ncbi:flagellar hook-basal body complex protein [Azospirillum halopraeferens]|uniref:flagellar hook-basal body complex protein n=1 Tax=Azospirillum halopraeferens TaxID=34010 RepID=UPI000401DB0B|nr:flagellar hook-basal body complex protein [Azospirillum halopraeferens]
MSIFGSMTTAVLGLNAQSRALGHISDNIANASTTGYKRVNTAFETLVLQSSQRLHSPGGVTAKPVFMNNIQGNLTQVQSPTNIAIQGQGFFSVTKLSTAASGGNAVQTQTGTVSAGATYYTRMGDFELDKSRYLVNSAGFALNGWMVDELSGELRKDQIRPIQVNTLTDRPTPTAEIDLSANLPATPAPGMPIPTSSIQIYDTQGNPRTINLNWRQQGANDWRLAVDAPGSSAKPVDGTFAGYPATVTFGQNIAGVTPVSQVNTVTVFGQTSNGQANIRVGETYSVAVDGTTYSVRVTADNVAQLGTYTGVAGALANQINSASPAAPVMATLVDGNVIRLVARNAGTPFKVSQEITSVSPTNNTVTGPTTTAATTTAGEIQKYSFPQSQIDIGDVFRIRVRNNGQDTTVAVTVTAQTYSTYANITGVVQELANRINAATGLNVTASSAGGVLTIQDNVAGGSFDATSSAGVSNSSSAANTLTGAFSIANVAGVRQQRTVTLTGTPGDIGTLYSLSINGTPVTYSTTGKEMTMEDITAALANKINSNTSLPVTATAQGGVITIISKTPDGDAADQFSLQQTAVTGQTPAHIGLTFGTTPETVGTLTGLSTALVGTGTAVSAATQSAGTDAMVTFVVNYGFGPQTIKLNMGQFQRPGGLTQYAGEEINVTQFVQDGAPRGQFKDVVFGDNGNVVVNYDNGRSKVIGRVPIVTFNNPNALQRDAGGVFIETQDAGKPNFNDPQTNGAGAVIANSIEGSNVDIADEFTKLIVTQRTYSANTKIVTTSDEMLQEVLSLKR